MPEFCPTTPPGLLLATDLRACSGRLRTTARHLTNQLVHSLVTLTVCNVPQAPGEARLRAGNVSRLRTRAPENTMNKPKIALRLCARRYLSHCPEG